jgi:serine/threonine-protein kinase
VKVIELSNVLEDDDTLLQVERFKMGLIQRATGGSYDDIEYNKLRKLILTIPKVSAVVPRFLKICRTTGDFWEWIKNEASTYAERREIISNSLAPILEILEYESSEGAIEFGKNYVEKEIIGQGGFGLVYLYEHILLKMPFAVKIFAPAFYQGEETELERFFQEARILFQLNHPSIIKIYDVGLIGKRPFIRMEYFQGKNLNQILHHYGRIPPEKALVMMKNIVSGMQHAHEEVGVIHRDLKPSNIMAAPPEQFRIIDFGLGLFIENDLHTRFTKTGEATVSGYYNAPELVQNPKLIDKRSDIYSLGAIWFTMLTGQPPAGTSIRDTLNSVGGLSKEYIECILSCLANLENRVASCELLLKIIEEIE